MKPFTLTLAAPDGKPIRTWQVDHDIPATMFCDLAYGAHREQLVTEIRDEVRRAKVATKFREECARVWHRLTPADCERIPCQARVAEGFGFCSKPTFACEHGDGGGPPFFYYCLQHSLARGYSLKDTL